MNKTAIAGDDAPPWAAVAEAPAVSADAAADALTVLETHRTQWVGSQRAAALRLVRAATELGRDDLRRRAQLVLADSMIRQDDLTQGSTLARRVQADAQPAGDAFALARAHYLLAWVTHTIADAASARVNALRGVELLADDAHPAIVMDHLTIAAIAMSPDPKAMDYFAEALAVARDLGDPERIVGILNNQAYMALKAGNLPLATQTVAEMTALAAEAGGRVSAARLDTVARVYIATGRFEDAVEVLEPIRQILPQFVARAKADYAQTRGRVRGMITLAQAYRGLGRLDDADDLLTRADAAASTASFSRLAASILQERARGHAARGDFERAYRAYVEFHRESTALQADDDRNRALIARATVNADKSRQRARHFRELAMRDALTGIYNRRYLDDLLTTMVAGPGDGPFSVAIIDIDHFKLVNDDFSHDVGDEVLRTLASVLVDAKPRSATVCRFGGEEFVAVMPETDAATGLATCESIREAVRSTAWPQLPEGRSITVSIGVSTARRGHITRSEMLSKADQNLYAAKRSGRNRVIGDAR